MLELNCLCFQAACEVKKKGFDPRPEIMIPLVTTVNELDVLKPVVEAAAKTVFGRYGFAVPYTYGTMVETPRGALTAAAIAKTAEFFSFGTNDLTQVCLCAVCPPLLLRYLLL
jgi:pyruvate,orthophosphate dikinase